MALLVASCHLITRLALTGAGWALGSNWTEVMGLIKPFEGIVNELLALLIVAVVVTIVIIPLCFDQSLSHESVLN